MHAKAVLSLKNRVILIKHVCVGGLTHKLVLLTVGHSNPFPYHFSAIVQAPRCAKNTYCPKG